MPDKVGCGWPDYCWLGKGCTADSQSISKGSTACGLSRWSQRDAESALRWRSKAGALGHVQPRLNEQARACLVHFTRQCDACCGDLVQLEIGIRVPVGGKPLQSLQLFILWPPHRFTATCRCGRTQDQLRTEKMEHMRMPVVFTQAERHGSADQIGEAERGAYIAFALEHAVEPRVFFKPKPCFDDV